MKLVFQMQCYLIMMVMKLIVQIVMGVQIYLFHVKKMQIMMASVMMWMTV